MQLDMKLMYLYSPSSIEHGSCKTCCSDREAPFYDILKLCILYFIYGWLTLWQPILGIPVMRCDAWNSEWRI